MKNAIKSVYRLILPAKVKSFNRKMYWKIAWFFALRKKPINYAISNGMRFNVIPDNFWNRFNGSSFIKWELETIRFFRKYVSPDKEVIDIGGCIGATMLIAYSCNPQKIYVIEADPSNYQILKQNVFSNYLNDKVELFNHCIADKNDGMVTFGYADENVHDISTKCISSGGSGVRVKTITLENFLETKNMENVNIVKIDIEGGEQYIENGLRYIAKFPDINVFLSIHTPFWNDKKETASMLMRSFENYNVYTEQEETLTNSELEKMMLDETPTIYKNKTGRFFTLILKTK